MPYFAKFSIFKLFKDESSFALFDRHKICVAKIVVTPIGYVNVFPCVFGFLLQRKFLKELQKYVLRNFK